MTGAEIAPLLRMIERFLIVGGGILSIYLGYRLFVLGIDKTQGAASAWGVELKNFGPGLFFAALGAVILVTTMRAAISVGAGADVPAAPIRHDQTGKSEKALFFGIEDPSRENREWTATSFYIETRQLLRRLDQGESPDKLTDLRSVLKGKLGSITMSADEYARYQALTQKLPLGDQEQRELQELERKLFP